MEITNIRFRKKNSSRVLAVATIIIDDFIVINDILIINGSERLFIAMPSRMDKDGCFRDVVHPIDSKSRAKLEKVVIRAYEDYLTKTFC